MEDGLLGAFSDTTTNAMTAIVTGLKSRIKSSSNQERQSTSVMAIFG